jgi:two-component system sensor histidine kinase/response regulator
MPPKPVARLLIVDDEPSLLNALQATLRDEGFAVTAVTSGAAALETLSHQHFDLVMTDLVMPGVDGVALLTQALALDPDLSGIVMTGHGSIPSAVAAMKAGAIDYVLKPITLSVMLPVLERALLIRRLKVKNARLERRIGQRTLDLEMANAELEAFSSSVSHDLRTPLRALCGFVEILLGEKEESLPPNARKLVGFIDRSAAEMDELITGLLELSRLGLHALTREPVDLESVGRAAFASLDSARAGRQIEFKLQPLPTVSCDRTLIKLVFVNLLSNAIKYTRPRDTAEIKVGSAALPGETSPVYFVRDNGVGFDLACAENLFGVFQRLHHARDFEGAGVGLATVRRIVERHGGTIWAEAAPGAGATFFFTLPETDPDAD